MLQLLGTFIRPVVETGQALLGRHENACEVAEPPQPPGSSLLRRLVGLLVGKGRGLNEICACLIISSDLVQGIIAYIGAASPHERPMRNYTSRRFWSLQEKRLLLQLWPTVLSIDEIAREIGRDRRAVLVKARALGLYVRGRSALQILARESAETAALTRDEQNSADAVRPDVTLTEPVDLVEPVDLIVSDPPYGKPSELVEKAAGGGSLVGTQEEVEEVAAPEVIGDLADIEFVSPVGPGLQDLAENSEEPAPFSNDEQASVVWEADSVDSDSVFAMVISARDDSAAGTADLVHHAMVSQPENTTAADGHVENPPSPSLTRKIKTDPKLTKKKRKGRQNQKVKAAKSKIANGRAKRTTWTEDMKAVAFVHFDCGLTAYAAGLRMGLSEGAVRSFWSKIGLAGRKRCNIWRGEGPSPIRGAASHLVETEDRHTHTMFYCKKKDKALNWYSPATRRSVWAKENDIARKHR